MARLTGYLGTYRSPKSAGVFRFTVETDSGALSVPALFCDAPDAKYLALRDRTLAAPVRGEKGAGLALIDLAAAAPRAQTLLTEESGGCYVVFDGDYIHTANFHAGTVSVYRRAENALSLHTRLSFGAGAGCHQVLVHGDTLLVPCMEQDRICLIDKSADFAQAGEIAFAPGTGPRHGVFDRAHERLFVVAEKECAVYSYRAQNGFSYADQVVLLPPGAFPGSTAAAIRLSADERFLYVSVRGANQLAVLAVEGERLALLQLTGSGGDHPRDIALSPDGRLLLAANRFSGELVSFAVDTGSGLIGKELCRVPAPEAVSILFDASITEPV